MENEAQMLSSTERQTQYEHAKPPHERLVHFGLKGAPPKYTIAGFIEQTIYPTVGSLQRHLANVQLLVQPNRWPQRPLPIAQALHDLYLISHESHLTAGQSQQQV
ncbi:uncharacterized protein [Musca autumnalis]|uniref:uncharacterized protein n=1 Tax=Musca autumnalis TaxID=221902 RepID=UPI003CEDF04F